VAPGPPPLSKMVLGYIRTPQNNRDRGEILSLSTHTRIFENIDPTPKTVDSLMRLDLPAGVDIEIKL
jgi:small subunit ribosomal protein S10